MEKVHFDIHLWRLQSLLSWLFVLGSIEAAHPGGNKRKRELLVSCQVGSKKRGKGTVPKSILRSHPNDFGLLLGLAS
jgi:hypothetical protein